MYNNALELQTVICNAAHCGAQGWCKKLKVVLSCS